MNNTSNQHTYLLRLWQADDGSWRILLQKPTDERPEGFTTVEDLSIHLKTVTSAGLPIERSQPFIGEGRQGGGGQGLAQ